MTNKLWELYLPTEADYFKTFWTYEGYFDEWVMNWFYPMALEHGMPEVTDEQKQEWIDSNFGMGERAVPVHPDDYEGYFAEEYYWKIIGYFEKYLEKLGCPKNGCFVRFNEKIIYADFEVTKSMRNSEVYARAW